MAKTKMLSVVGDGGIECAPLAELYVEPPRTEAPMAAEPREAHQAATGEAPAPSQTDLLIERWFLDSFHGSAVARDTQTWAAVYEAKEELKRLLNRSV